MTKIVWKGQKEEGLRHPRLSGSISFCPLSSFSPYFTRMKRQKMRVGHDECLSDRESRDYRAIYYMRGIVNGSNDSANEGKSTSSSLLDRPTPYIFSVR